MPSTTSRALPSNWPAIRLAVLQRDGYVCAYCGREANQVDHIIARANGGGDEMSNLVAACAEDNGRKSDTPLVRLSWFNRNWLDRL